jgi:hypothetical protein
MGTMSPFHWLVLLVFFALLCTPFVLGYRLLRALLAKKQAGRDAEADAARIAALESRVAGLEESADRSPQGRSRSSQGHS